MAIAKLCALCCLVVQFHFSQALQVCLANNGKQNQPTATLTLQPANCQPAGKTVQNIATAYQAQQAIHVPIQFSQLHLQPLETSVGKVQIPMSTAQFCQSNPAMSLTIATPAAAPVGTLVTKCNQCGQQKVQVRQQPQAVVSAVPCSGVSRNAASPITLNLAPYTQSRAVQSQPCVPRTCQSAPVQVPIDAGQPKCTCAQTAVPFQRSQPSYVLTNQGAVPVQSSYVSLRQEIPPPYVLTGTSPQQYATKPVYTSKSPTTSAQSSKTSNLKMILPLLFNLIKEKQLNCGCPSKCNCGLYGNDSSVYSGYSSSAAYDLDDQPIFDPAEFDQNVFPEDLRDRKTNQIDSEVKESSKSDQPMETTTFLNEIKE